MNECACETKIGIRYRLCFWRVGCAQCGQGFELRAFQPEAEFDDGYHPICDECYTAAMPDRAWALPLLDVLANYLYVLSDDLPNDDADSRNVFPTKAEENSGIENTIARLFGTETALL